MHVGGLKRDGKKAVVYIRLKGPGVLLLFRPLVVIYFCILCCSIFHTNIWVTHILILIYSYTDSYSCPPALSSNVFSTFIYPISFYLSLKLDIYLHPQKFWLLYPISSEFQVTSVFLAIKWSILLLNLRLFFLFLQLFKFS